MEESVLLSFSWTDAFLARGIGNLRLVTCDFSCCECITPCTSISGTVLGHGILLIASEVVVVFVFVNWRVSFLFSHFIVDCKFSFARVSYIPVQRQGRSASCKSDQLLARSMMNSREPVLSPK